MPTVYNVQHGGSMQILRARKGLQGTGISKGEGGSNQ